MSPRRIPSPLRTARTASVNPAAQSRRFKPRTTALLVKLAPASPRAWSIHVRLSVSAALRNGARWLCSRDAEIPQPHPPLVRDAHESHATSLLSWNLLRRGLATSISVLPLFSCRRASSSPRRPRWCHRYSCEPSPLVLGELVVAELSRLLWLIADIVLNPHINFMVGVLLLRKIYQFVFMRLCEFGILWHSRPW